MMNIDKERNRLEIKLCLGSSCFSRGNKTALDLMQSYIKSNNLEDKVSLRGSLCEELCKTGPHVFFGEEHYTNVDPSTVIDLMKFHLEQKPDVD